VGVGKIALAGLLANGAAASALAAPAGRANPLAPKQPHFTPKAKAVIHLFMAGAPSHLDLFDPKPKLSELEGKPIPPSVIMGQRYAFIRPDAAVLKSEKGTFYFIDRVGGIGYLGGMPRTARASVGGLCYHVLNRGNARDDVFHKDGDFAAFLQLMADANERLPMRILAYVLMHNHFHLVLWPRKDGDLSRWMQWLMSAHVRRYHRHYHGSGHVWQGRFKAFPIQQDEHLLTVQRYVERNPLRANLVSRAEDWAWSSLAWRPSGKRPEMLSDGPVPLPRNWLARVNKPQTETEVAAMQRSIERGTPYGSEPWAKRTATRLGLQSTLRPRGRPRKYPEK
jgi:putative transposase